MTAPNVTPEKTISFKLRDFVGIVIFLISLGVTMGGYIFVINSVKDLQAKVDRISDKLDIIGQRTASMEGYLKRDSSPTTVPAPAPAPNK